MNLELHHKWNAERDATRGSSKEGPQLEEVEQRKQNKVLLKQSKPR